MATRKRLTLDVWIRDAMADERDGQKCSMIALVHTIGALSKEVHHVKFGSGKAYTPEDLALMFRGRAEGYAQDLSGSQMFQLLAFYGKGEAEAFQPFTVQPAVDPNNPLPSEPATVDGQRQQGMRHTEMVFQQAYRKQEHLDNASNRNIELLSKTVADLMSQNMAMFTMTKEMLMEQALNTHKYRMEEMGYERSSAERKKWISFVPMLANTITGRELFPQSNADTVLIEQIMENVDKDAITLLAQFVKPELMGPLMQRFEQIQEKKNLAEANKNTAMIPVLKGEDDAGGGT